MATERTTKAPRVPPSPDSMAARLAKPLSNFRLASLNVGGTLPFVDAGEPEGALCVIDSAAALTTLLHMTWEQRDDPSVATPSDETLCGCFEALIYLQGLAAQMLVNQAETAKQVAK